MLDFVAGGSYDITLGLPLLIERVQIMVQYTIAVMVPITETPAMEFKLGKYSARAIAMNTNTKKHSIPFMELGSQVAPSLHRVLTRSFMVPPPKMISCTHIPPDRYITGNIVSNFPSLGPENKKKHIQSIVQYITNHLLDLIKKKSLWC
jgi:hypothetical protein